MEVKVAKNKALNIIVFLLTLAISLSISFSFFWQANKYTLTICNSITKQHCWKKYHNPEKIPSLFYNVVHNKTFVNESRIVFRVNTTRSLPYESRLVAAADAIEEITLKAIHNKIISNTTVRIVYAKETRTVKFKNCVDGSVLFAEMVQMDIKPLLHGAYATFIFLF